MSPIRRDVQVCYARIRLEGLRPRPARNIWSHIDSTSRGSRPSTKRLRWRSTMTQPASPPIVTCARAGVLPGAHRRRRLGRRPCGRHHDSTRRAADDPRRRRGGGVAAASRTICGGVADDPRRRRGGVAAASRTIRGGVAAASRPVDFRRNVGALVPARRGAPTPVVPSSASISTTSPPSALMPQDLRAPAYLRDRTRGDRFR